VSGSGWQALVIVLFGALAGGLTNSVAIWMLFHPYEPPRLRGRRLGLIQGAIPKNRERLAAAMGRTVGSKLLTPEDLARIVAEPTFRAAFDERLRAFIAGALERERGSLASLLPPAVAAELRELLREAAAGLVERLDAYLASDEFRAAAARAVATLAAELRDRPVGDVLTPEREQALTAFAERWLQEVVEGAGFQRAIADYLDRSAERLLVPDRTFEALVPVGLVAAIERGIAGYLPVALERLAGLLEGPEARVRLEKVLHEILDRFMKDLRFHQRLVAALVITPDTVEKVLKAIEAEGATKISELLHDPEMRDAMARSVNEGVVEFLRRPVVSVLGRPGDASVEDAKRTITGWVLGLARDPQTHAFVLDRVRGALAAAERRTWGDVLRHVPEERVVDLVVSAARSERAGALYRDAAARLTDLALARPIGRPATLLPGDAPARIEGTIADPLWGWLQEQVPAVARRVDVAARVEQKILDFPMQKVEELVRGVTERELQLIVRLGYVLGALIGLLSVTINALIS
jgi:uncharacterized membrane protein YheB (UPF0754 family)